MKMTILIAAALAAAALATLPSDDDGVTRAGYFKSERGDRVVAYEATTELSDLEARAVLRMAPTTKGRTTIAVLYHPGNPSPGAKLTTSKSLTAAANLIAQAPHDDWAVRLRVNAAGLQAFD